MTRERMLLIGLAVLLGGALLFAGAAAGQRSAWMEGYMMGRLSVAATGAEAGAGAAAALLPYGPYGMGFTHRGPGLGGVFFLILGLGAVAFIASRCFHRARWRAWMAAQGAQAGPQGEWRYGPPPPWAHGPWAHGPWAGSAPAGPPEQGQPPVQPSQPPAPEPPAQPPAADR